MFGLFRRKKTYPAYVELPIPEGCREMTEYEKRFVVNGGSERRENSHEGVAGANVGDTIQRNDGTVVTLNQGDIDYAKAQLGIRDSGSGTSVSGSVGGSGSNGNTQSSPSSPSSPTKTNDATANTVKGPEHHSAYDQQYINEMMENARKNALSGSGIQGTAVSGKRIEGKIIENNDDFLTPESNGKYAIDNKTKTIIVDKNNIDSVHDGYKAFYILSDRGYTFQVKDGAEVSETFNNDKDAKKYVNDLYPANGNLSAMLGSVSTNTGIVNVTADKIIDYADDAARFTKLAKYSSRASKVSSVTGVAATVLDTGHLIMNPTFHNFSTLTSDAVGFIPEIGPFASAGVSYVSEKIEDAAQAGIQIASRKMQFEYRIDSMMGNNSSVIFGAGMNPKYVINSSFLQGLNWFFGKE